MRERLEGLVGRRARAMWVMTFHSACARMLRADAHRLGYTRQFTIYDAADSRRLIKKCLDDLDIDVKRFTPRAMQAQISDAKNKLRSADDYRQMVGSFFEQTVADVYEHYEREIHRMNAMDFDDLLVRTVNVLELFPEVRDRYGKGFRHILVDEYQDTNAAQYRIVAALSRNHPHLYAFMFAPPSRNPEELIAAASDAQDAFLALVSDSTQADDPLQAAALLLVTTHGIAALEQAGQLGTTKWGMTGDELLQVAVDQHTA
jgi:superfamily I DNA/RNA helicase